MNENLDNKVTILPPFKRFCMTIGELPTSYLESMTYYESLVWLCNYLQKTVIPTINANGEAVIELQEKYIELKEYVDNYFENLDVQEEINNKLDDMAEQGELATIIALYLQMGSILAFDTKSALKGAENVADGTTCKTLGETDYNDGKGSLYKIRELEESDVIDDDQLLELTNYPTLVAEKLPDINNVVPIDTKTALKSAKGIVYGATYQTLGDTSINDGKGNLYKIRTLTLDDTTDDDSLVALTNYPSLVAERINSINIKPIKNITLGCFHKSYGSANKKSYLFLSTDNYNFSRIPNIEINNYNNVFSDPFITWDKTNKQFIITTDNQQDGYSATIATTKDLVHYNYFNITLNYPITVGNNKFGPTLLWDNDKLYLLITVNESGYTVANWHIFIAECTDIETMTFANATEISYSGDSDLYDINILKFNSKYYMVGANQTTGHVEMYESTTLNNFTQINENLYEIEGVDNVCEGPRMTIVNNKLMCISELNNDRLFALCEMTNPGTVDKQKIVKSLSTYKVGNFIIIDDLDALKVIQNLNFVYNDESNYNDDTRLNILTLEEDTEIEKYTIMPNKTLVINGNYNLTIKNVVDPFKLKKLPIIINSENIDITIQKYNNDSAFNRTYSFKNNMIHYNYRLIDFYYYTTSEFADNYINRFNNFTLETNSKFTLFNQQAYEVNKVKTINITLKATDTACDNVKILNITSAIKPVVDTLLPLYDGFNNIVGSAKITSSGVTVKANSLTLNNVYFINGTYI